MKISILGSTSTPLCQINSLREGFSILGHEHTDNPYDPDVAFVFIGNPPFDEYFELARHKKVIFNVLDLCPHCHDHNDIVYRLTDQLPLASRITTISQTVAGELKEKCGVNSSVIYYPSKPIFHTGFKKYEGLRATLVGRLGDPNKQSRLGIGALLRAGIKEDEIAIVGPENIGFGRYFGLVSNEELNDIYNSVDYVVSMAQNEGIGLSPIEGAMAGAIPIVSPALSTFNEFWLHSPLGMHYQSFRTVDSVANLILSIESDPIWKSQLKQDFLKYAQDNFVKKFDKVEVAKRILDVYLSI